MPNVSTSVYGAYTQVRYSDAVINSRLFCAGGGGAAQNILIGAGITCDPGFNFWVVGVVQNWYPVAGFRLAVNVQWTGIQTAFDGQTITLNKTQGARPTGTYFAQDDGILAVVFRAQRAFATGE